MRFGRPEYQKPAGNEPARVGIHNPCARSLNGRSGGWRPEAKLQQGKREELITIPKSSAAKMPGCYSYTVANDSAGEK
jgi:hypothetical protein